MDDADEELWATAAALVGEHGADAPVRAAQEADAAFERVVLDGAHLWRVIMRRSTILLDRRSTTRH